MFKIYSYSFLPNVLVCSTYKKEAAIATSFCMWVFRQSVTQAPASEGAVAGVIVGHTLIQRVCNTLIGPGRLVSGGIVGHFGKNDTNGTVPFVTFKDNL